MRIKVKCSKSRLIAGILFAAVFFFVCSYLIKTESTLLVGTVTLLILLTFLFEVEPKNERMRMAFAGILIAATAVLDFYFAHSCIGKWEFIDQMHYRNQILNVTGYMVIILFFYTLSQNIKLSCCVSTSLALILATANHYVVAFRGNEMVLADLLSIGTAMNVVRGYQFVIEDSMLKAWLLAALWLTFLFASVRIGKPAKGRRMTALALGLCILAVACNTSRIKKESWLDDGTTQNGTLVNFFAQQRFYRKPKGYSQAAVKAEEDRYESAAASVTDPPDIVVIMDEAFADLRVYQGELNTNAPFMPFYDSLEENTVKGYALSSVFGGGTANSEYEFLCGNNMAFMPQGAIGFLEYVNADTYSLAKYLKSLDYETVGMHPYLRNGWRRQAAWPELGLTETYFREDFPGEKLLRGYVSDQEMFEQVVQKLNNRETDTPMFLFGVTMQNHGGYWMSEEPYRKRITVEGYAQEYPEASEYLTLIHETDTALQYLVESIQQMDRNVVVLIYGDHQPKVENALFKELNGGSFQDLQDTMKKYVVPFCIWANFDIPEETVELTSLSFLSNYLLESAGIGLPSYNQFLRDVEAVIPSMNQLGYYSRANQRFMEYVDAEGEEKSMLERYQVLQYNSVKGGKKRSQVFFPQ